MKKLFINENLFFLIEEGNFLVWNFKEHEQFLIEEKYFNELLYTSKTGKYNQKDLNEELLASNLLTQEEPKANNWGWDILSKIFHVGTENDNLATHSSDHSAEYFINHYTTECENLDNIPELYSKRNGDKFTLPDPDLSIYENFSLYRSMKNRKTCRKFLSKQINLNLLSTILFGSFGIFHGEKWEDFSKNDLKQTAIRKASPASGGLHTEEAYVVIYRIEGMEAGIYFYDVKNHELVLISQGDFEEKVIRMNSQQYFSKGLAFGIYITSKFNKSWWKYKHSRAYRAILMDIGHVSQTFQLCATACGLHTWLTGEFIDEEVREFLKIEGNVENPILFVAAGVGTGETFPAEMIHREGLWKSNFPCDCQKSQKSAP